MESGRAGKVRIDDVIGVIAALGGYLSVRVMYQGEALDRLRDRRHAELVEVLVALLIDLGWEVATEVSFSRFGERGSIDILAFHRPTRTLLVIEVKTVVPDIGGMLATLDRKVRLAGEIARERGWDARHHARLLVVPEDRTARRRVLEHDATFRASFPDRNVDVNAWLRAPSGVISGLMFLSAARQTSQRRGTRGSAAGPGPNPRTSA
jgi:Holliday junction resolvase-like predicted endonuclease